MKFLVAVVAALACMETLGVGACPAFRFRYAGSNKKQGDECLSTTSLGELSVVPCDDNAHDQMMVIEGNTISSHVMSTAVAADINRTKMNTYTVAIGGKCVAKKGKLVNCPRDASGKAAKKAMKLASWYLEPLLGSEPTTVMPSMGHDGHDHSSTASSSYASYTYMPAGHSMDDGHDHSGVGHSMDDGHDHGGSSSSYTYMPAGHSMDDGHDHGGSFSSYTYMPAGHSMDDGHDHGHDHSSTASSSYASYTYMPAGHSMDDGHDHSGVGGSHDGHDHGETSSFNLGGCRFVNGKIQCY